MSSSNGGFDQIATERKQEIFRLNDKIGSYCCGSNGLGVSFARYRTGHFLRLTYLLT